MGNGEEVTGFASFVVESAERRLVALIARDGLVQLWSMSSMGDHETVFSMSLNNVVPIGVGFDSLGRELIIISMTGGTMCVAAVQSFCSSVAVLKRLQFDS